MKARTIAACHADAVAEIMATIWANPPIPRVSLPVDVEDAERFPNIARARDHLVALDPAYRARLEAEWNGEPA